MNGTKSSPLGFVEQGAKSLTVQLLALIRQRRHHPEGKIRFALILIGNVIGSPTLCLVGWFQMLYLSNNHYAIIQKPIMGLLSRFLYILNRIWIEF